MYEFYRPTRLSEGITKDPGKQLEILKKEIRECDAILIGAGAGLSTAAGMTYSGERFRKYFADFEEKYCDATFYTWSLPTHCFRRLQASPRAHGDVFLFPKHLTAR